jgi:hypothetical protein
MRVAETLAVNRALRRAYGIGICSVEEIGSLPVRTQPEPNVRKLPPQSVNGNGGPKLRDSRDRTFARYSAGKGSPPRLWSLPAITEATKQHKSLLEQ